MTYGTATVPGNTSPTVDSRRAYAASSVGDTGLGSSPLTSVTSTWGSLTVRRIRSMAPSTVSPTMTRMLTWARAVAAMTLAPGRAGELGHGDGRPGQRRGLVPEPREDPGEHGPQQARTTEDRGIRHTRMGAGALEHVDGGVGQVAREGLPLEAQDRAGEPARRAHPTRRGRVATVAARDEVDVDGALLGDADDGHRRVDARERALHDGAALVDDEPRLDPSLAQDRDGVLGGARPTPPRCSRTRATRRGPA